MKTAKRSSKTARRSKRSTRAGSRPVERSGKGWKGFWKRYCAL